MSKIKTSTSIAAGFIGGVAFLVACSGGGGGASLTNDAEAAGTTTPLLSHQSATLYYTKAGSMDEFWVQITEGKVVGGHAQGSYGWTAVGGYYDGENMTVVFVTDGSSGCNKLFSHTYTINSDSNITLNTSVNSCGEATLNRNVTYDIVKWK